MNTTCWYYINNAIMQILVVMHKCHSSLNVFLSWLFTLTWLWGKWHRRKSKVKLTEDKTCITPQEIFSSFLPAIFFLTILNLFQFGQTFFLSSKIRCQFSFRLVQTLVWMDHTSSLFFGNSHEKKQPDKMTI